MSQATTPDPASEQGAPTPASAEAAPWRPVNRARAHELVVERIEEQILAGTLRVGDRLPAERDLASMLQVSRAAVREAIRALEAQGVVTSTVGAGRDAGTIVSALPIESLTRFLRLHVALANFPLRDVLASRIMLERGSVILAAENAGADELDRLERLVDAMDDPAITRERFNTLDTEYHVAIAEAGGNRLAAAMTTAIRASLAAVLLASFHDSTRWEELVDDLRRHHRAVLDAIRARDPRRAAEELESHIRFAYGAFLDGSESPPPGAEV